MPNLLRAYFTHLVRIGVAGSKWSVRVSIRRCDRYSTAQATIAVAAVAVTAVAVKSSVSGVEAGGCVGDSGEKDDLR